MIPRGLDLPSVLLREFSSGLLARGSLELLLSSAMGLVPVVRKVVSLGRTSSRLGGEDRMEATDDRHARFTSSV